MIIIVCVDENNGMMFNKRRQSRDSELIKRIEEYTEGRTLVVEEYSKPLFSREVTVGKELVKKGDFFFNETVGDISSFSPQKIILYKWNRKYPSDLKLSLDLRGMKLVSSTDFKGSSHEKITEEIYEII